MACPKCNSERFDVKSFASSKTKGGLDIIKALCICKECWTIYEREFANEYDMSRLMENYSD